MLTDFRNCKGLKAKIGAGTETQKNLNDLEPADRQEIVEEIVAKLNADIATHRKTQSAVSLEAIFLRNELQKAANVPASETDVTSTQLWEQGLFP